MKTLFFDEYVASFYTFKDLIHYLTRGKQRKDRNILLVLTNFILHKVILIRALSAPDFHQTLFHSTSANIKIHLPAPDSYAKRLQAIRHDLFASSTNHICTQSCRFSHSNLIIISPSAQTEYPVCNHNKTSFTLHCSDHQANIIHHVVLLEQTLKRNQTSPYF